MNFLSDCFLEKKGKYHPVTNIQCPDCPTFDINRDMDLGEPVVTEDGILKDDKAQCQALLNRITVEIDMKLDMLSYLKGLIVPGRNIQNQDYNRVFDETTKHLYEVITGKGCPELVMTVPLWRGRGEMFKIYEKMRTQDTWFLLLISAI